LERPHEPHANHRAMVEQAIAKPSLAMVVASPVITGVSFG
jgi:hypothetical protein